MSTSISTVDWNESKVEAKPDIATDTLTSASITIDSSNVENIKSADFIDTNHFSMNDYETDYYIGIDYSCAITKRDYITIDVSKLDIQQWALYLVLFDDEPKVFSGNHYWYAENGGGSGSMQVDVIHWTEIRFLEDREYKPKYYWRGYIVGGGSGSYGKDKITRITINISQGSDSLLTINDEHQERLILGYCRLFLNRRNEFTSKTKISSYAQARHENSMLVLPKLVSSSFKGLINSAFCSPSDYVINLNSTLSNTTLTSTYYPYYIEVEGDYVIVSDDEVTTYERRYSENNENIDYISPHSGSLIGSEIKIAHIPANTVLMIKGKSCLISRIH